MSYHSREGRGRGGFQNRTHRGGFNHHDDLGLKITIPAHEIPKRSRSPEWRNGRGGFNNRGRRSDMYGDRGGRNNWIERNRKDDNFTDTRDDRSRSNEATLKEIGKKVLKRKYPSEHSSRDNKFDNFDRRDDGFGQRSSRDPPSPFAKRPHFQNPGFRGGSRGSSRPFDRARDRGFGNKSDQSFDKETFSNRQHYDNDRTSRSRSLSERHSRSFSGSKHRTDKHTNRKNISDFISNIRNKTSSKSKSEPSKEEAEIETQVIDEKLYETMSIDQRDYVASKALNILVTKPDSRCKLSQLEYELMDIKIMFVSSELFLEFLQSFIDDDNVFEIIHPEPKVEEKADGKKEAEDGKIKMEAEDGKIKIEAEESVENEDNDESNYLENTIVVGRPKFIICQKYIANIHSCSRDCGSLHLCKFYMLSRCNPPPGKKCIYTHTIDTDNNQSALRINLLHTFTMQLLRSTSRKLIFRNPTTLPPICWYYNANKRCVKWNNNNCPFFHLCESLLKGKTCVKGSKCTLNHDVLANVEVLTKFGLWSPEFPVEDLLKTISENFIRYDSYARKYPEQNKDRDDYYTKSITQKAKWQLYIPSDEMWVDLVHGCHKELESKHRALSRAQLDYDEALEEMKHFKVGTLTALDKEIPEICNKVFRRLEPSAEVQTTDKSAAGKTDENEKEEKE